MLEILLFYVFGVFATILIGIVFNRTNYVAENHETNHFPFDLALAISLFSWFGLLFFIVIAVYMMFEEFFKNIHKNYRNTLDTIKKFFENRK